MSAANQLPYLMTVAEFLDWETPDGSDRWELIDGTPEAMAPASDRHGAIHAQAARLLANHLDDHPRCRVIVQPGVTIGEYNLRIPDLSVSCSSEHAADEGRTVLIIEILSPSNVRDTWRAVVGYTTSPSVAEILVLHSTEIKAEFLRRTADGPWPRMTLLAGDDVTLESIGFTAPLVAFYRTSGLAA
jgi:Uma2 family endonuclease